MEYNFESQAKDYLGTKEYALYVVINVCDEILHRYVNEMIAKQDLLNGILFFCSGV